MSGNNLLLDTNILIYLSKKQLKLEDFASKDDELYISFISIMEAKGYQFSNKQEERIIDSLCDNLIKVHITDEVIKKVINFRKKHTIKLPDAIILASAIEYNLKLVTRNIIDFQVAAPAHILINPFGQNR